MALLSGDATNTISAETAEKIKYDPQHQNDAAKGLGSTKQKHYLTSKLQCFDS